MASRIAELAASILADTTTVDHYLAANNLPQPSFEADGPITLGIDAPEVEAARLRSIEASIELKELLEGPIAGIRPDLNAASLQAIYKFDIASKVPLDGEISFDEIAELCGLYETDMRRILRYAMAHHRCFKEPRKGYVAHTAASRRLAEDPVLRDGIGFSFDQIWQAQAHTVEALQRFKGQEPHETGHAIAHKCDTTLYGYLESHPAINKRFANAMEASKAEPGLSQSYTVKGFPWQDYPNSTVVDIGGSKGHISIDMATEYPSLKLVVQDLPQVITRAREDLPVHLKDRIEFMSHDFFTEQPLKGADIYFFRYIFHNWPDAYVIKILQQLIPALKKGARVVVNEPILPEPGTLSLLLERRTRKMDMNMLSLCNARERDRQDWEQLFRGVDERFRVVRAYTPKGALLGFLEAVWDDDEDKAAANGVNGHS